MLTGTLSAQIERNAVNFENCEAFVDGKRRLTYGQYADRVRRLASAFQRMGARRQDRIAFLSRNSVEVFEIFGACEWAGFIPAPMNFRYAGPEVSAMMADAAPTILLYQHRYREAVATLRSSTSLAITAICIDGPAGDDFNFETLIADGSPEGPPFRARPEDYAHLFYTSGTTGRAKGVVHSHATICQWSMATPVVSEFTRFTTLLQTSPAFHVGGKLYSTALTGVGGKTVLQDGFEPVAVLDAIERERVTFTFMVAAMVQALLAVPGVETRDLSSITKIVSAAAPIPVPLLRQAITLLGPVFAIQYGCTEVGNICNLWRQEVLIDGTAVEVGRLASVGRPVPGIDLRIVDEAGHDCPTQVPGEVLVRGGVVPHYWNNDIATLDAVRDGWYHTGDIGRRDEEGYVFLVDRKKDMVVSGGENIYSREVENALGVHPLVQAAAVIGVPHPQWVEAVCAIVVPVAGAALDTELLTAHCRALIAGYKCPKYMVFVDELPALASGKIDKVGLRRRFAEIAAEPDSRGG